MAVLGALARAGLAAVLLLALPCWGRTGIALNLGTWAYHQSDLPTLDLMKKASPWITQCAKCRDLPAGASTWDTRESDRLDLDEQGWVTRLPGPEDSRHFREVATLLTAHGYQPAGEYVVLYRGQGTLRYNGAGQKLEGRSKPGRDVVQVRSDSTAAFWLTLTQIDPKNPIRDIRIYAPGGVCARAPRQPVASASACERTDRFIPNEELAESQWFSPGLLADTQGFRALRFMDWGRTNTSLLADWERRPRPTDRTWAGPDGVPLEAMLELARLSDADAWINLPTRSDERYAAALTALAKDRLAPGRKLILEYSNEPWNTAFSAASWLLEQGRSRWPSAAGRAQSQDLLRHNAYALRAHQLCRAARAATGGDRVQCVLNTQAASPGAIAAVLGCELARGLLQQAHCGQGMDAVAVAPYFGHYIGLRDRRPQVDAWLARPDGGLGPLFDEIFGTPDMVPLAKGAAKGALAMARDWMTEARRQAERHDLPLWAYEGGHHLTTFPGDPDSRFFALMKAAVKDPRMAQAYARMIGDWRQSGGQVFAYYHYTGLPSPWGAFGLKDTFRDDQSPLWLEVQRQRQQLGCWWPGC